MNTPFVEAFAMANQKREKPRKKPYKKPQAVRELESMADAENARRHPNTPVKYLAKSTYRDDTANGLTKCIIDFVRFNGGQAERINTTGIPIDTRREVTDIMGHRRTIGSVQWRPSGTTAGSADISAIIRGRAVKIEVKIGKDTQSEAQRQYQASIEAAGGIYYIAKDFTSFIQWYQESFELWIRIVKALSFSLNGTTIQPSWIMHNSGSYSGQYSSM